MTSRSIQAEQPGPAHIDVDLTSVDLTVVVEDGRDRAELTLHTDDDTGPSADAVQRAALDTSGQRITTRLTGNSTSVVIGGNVAGGGVVVSSGDIVVGHRVVMVNGQIISDSGATVPMPSRITAVAHVPAGSSVTARSMSGDVTTQGRLYQARVRTASGDVRLDLVGDAEVRSMSGNIRVQLHQDGVARLRSMSGDVTVTGDRTSHAKAKTMSGDVRGVGGVQLEGRSMSGRVRSEAV